MNKSPETFTSRLEDLIKRIDNNPQPEDFEAFRQEGIGIINEIRTAIGQDYPLDTNNDSFKEQLAERIGQPAALEAIAFLKENNYAVVKRDTKFRFLI